MKIKGLFFLTMFSLQVFAEVSQETQVSQKKQILDKLNLKTGHYTTIVPKKNPAAFCEDEELDIDLVEDQNLNTLVIGDKISLPNINKPEFKEETSPGCVSTFKNKITNGQIEQVVSESCKKSKKPIVTSYSVKLTEEKITIEKAQLQKRWTCDYKLTNLKGL